METGCGLSAKNEAGLSNGERSLRRGDRCRHDLSLNLRSCYAPRSGISPIPKVLVPRALALVPSSKLVSVIKVL